MGLHDDGIRALHISPGGPPPSDRPLPWNLNCCYMNECMPGKEAHIDSREPPEADWWKPFVKVERLELHGDMPGGFDTVGQFTELRELVIYDSPSLKGLDFLQGLLWLEQLQVIRCPLLAGAEPVAGLIRKQEQLREQGTVKNKYGEGVARMEAVCIIDCALDDLSPFERIENLFELDLRGNYITDVTPLANCRVHYLDLSRNRIEDIRPVYRLIRTAEEVYLNDNHIRDISGLTAGLGKESRGIPGLGTLKMWLGNNAIPKEQLRENEDCIRDIGPEDISPEKLEWIEMKYREFRPESFGGEDEDDGGLGRCTTIRYTARSLADCQELDRWPPYSIRGRPVSRETAREIIRKTDNYLRALEDPGDSDVIREIFERHGAEPRGCYTGSSVYAMRWFARPWQCCCGWCHPDGYIGIDDYSGVKIPFLDEMLDPWAFLIENVTKELDLVVGVSDKSESFDPNRPIADQLYSGYHIKGDTITLLDTARVRELYREYDAAYGDHALRGPLADPREGLRRGEREYWPVGLDGDYGIWEPGFCIIGDLDWHEPRESGVPGHLYKAIPGWNGRVDKNNVCYYGLPDYHYKTSPLTLKDLEDFAARFRAEQDERQKQEEGT